jgi:hypothetical protein
MQEVGFMPIWHDNSTRDKALHISYMKQSNGYCISCQKPLTYKHYLCTNCKRSLVNTGLEPKRVSYTDVGLSTINYQQNIHRIYFGCNAPYQYRGLKENRIKTNIQQSTIDKATHTLHNSLLNIEECNIKQLYKEIQSYRNCQRRLLYGITLYAISYYIEECKLFKHKAHYQASIVKQLENDIQRMYIRTHNNNKDKLNVISSANRNLSLSKDLYRIISICLSGIIVEVL